MHDTPRSSLLVGNRMVLIGAVLYLLEWVAIVAAHVSAPLGAGATTAEITAAYSGQEQVLGWAAGWFSVVLLGRVLIMTGLRSALSASGRPEPLMDIAVVAMAVGVVLEIATYAITAGAGWLLAHDGSVDQVRGLDAAAVYLNLMLWGPTGLALVCAAIAMWRSGLFPRVLTAIGFVSGLLLGLDAIALAAPQFASASDTVSSIALLFWVWMIWAGVLLWRHTPPRQAPAGATARHVV